MNVQGASQRRLPLLVIALLGLLLFTLPTMAADNGLTILSVSDGDTQQEYSVKLQILLLMTALSFLPAFILMATSFTRIIVVLAILRQALGLQQSPPNRVLVGIALALTLLIMRPVWTDIHDNAFKPYDNGEITLMQAFGGRKASAKLYVGTNPSKLAGANVTHCQRAHRPKCGRHFFCCCVASFCHQ